MPLQKQIDSLSADINTILLRVKGNGALAAGYVKRNRRREDHLGHKWAAKVALGKVLHSTGILQSEFNDTYSAAYEHFMQMFNEQYSVSGPCGCNPDDKGFWSSYVLPTFNLVRVRIRTNVRGANPYMVLPYMSLPLPQMQALATAQYRCMEIKNKTDAFTDGIFLRIRSILPPTARPALNHFVSMLGGEDVAMKLGIS